MVCLHVSIELSSSHSHVLSVYFIIIPDFKCYFVPSQKLENEMPIEMAKRAGSARPGPGPVKPGQNRARPAEPTGLSFCLSPARSGPKRAGPARLARKNGPKSGLNGPVSTF
jgi:hypothetical protein